jgi:hypothetical protein
MAGVAAIAFALAFGRAVVLRRGAAFFRVAVAIHYLRINPCTANVAAGRI